MMGVATLPTGLAGSREPRACPDILSNRKRARARTRLPVNEERNVGSIERDSAVMETPSLAFLVYGHGHVYGSEFRPSGEKKTPPGGNPAGSTTVPGGGLKGVGAKGRRPRFTRRRNLPSLLPRAAPRKDRGRSPGSCRCPRSHRASSRCASRDGSPRAGSR